MAANFDLLRLARQILGRRLKLAALIVVQVAGGGAEKNHAADRR